jgi:CYTH domain-containing protein
MNNTVNIEMERKFLVKELPKNIKDNLYSLEKLELIQCYLNNEYDSLDVRVRSINDSIFSLDIKDKGDKVRNEISVEISKEQFEQIYSVSSTKVINKTRYILAKDDISELVLDIYDSKVNNLMVIEYESKDINKVNNFKQDYWFINEITSDVKYKNRNLAINGLKNIV